MATITPVRVKKENRNGEAAVKIRVTSEGKTSFVSLNFKVAKEAWNNRKGQVRASHPNHRILNKTISERVADLQAKSLSGGSAVNITKKQNSESFFDFALNYIEQFNNEVQFNTFRSYETKLHKIRQFTKTDIKLTDITMEWLRNYETFLKDLGNGEGTRWCDLKTIRAIINGAIREDKLPITANPFLRYKIKAGTGQKARLSETEIQKLRDVELTGNHAIARDLFILAFNLRGTRISDMLLLSSDQIESGRINFVMAKTGKSMSIKLTPEAQVIVDRYNTGGLLFPFLKNTDSELKLRISSATAYLNKLLKEVSGKSGIDKHISTHVARHSWSQIAKNKGVPSAHIQNSLGHSSLRTTEMYLRDLDNIELDSVNSLVTDSCLHPYSFVLQI